MPVFSDEVVCIEESSTPRPHYRVTLKSVTRGHPNLLPGLVQDELKMTVHLPVEVGTDLNMIKQAATRRFAAHAAEITNHQLVGQRPDHQADSASNGSCPTLLDRGNGESQSREPIAVESEAD